MKVALMTNSGTGKSIGELAQAEIYNVPLQVSCDDKNHQNLRELGIDEVYALMKDGKMLSASLSSLGKIEEPFQGLKRQGYDMIFVIPIYSGLSGTTDVTEMVAQRQDIAFDYVNYHVIAVVQEYVIKLTKQLHETGKDIEQIKEVLQRIVYTTNTILLPNDLQCLKCGGRLAPLAATLGGLLKIKPILKIDEEASGKVGVLNRVRTMHKAMDRVVEITKRECVNDSYLIIVTHTDDEAEALVYMDKLKQAFPNATRQTIKLVNVVGVHTGRGCQAAQYFRQIKE